MFERAGRRLGEHARKFRRVPLRRDHRTDAESRCRAQDRANIVRIGDLVEDENDAVRLGDRVEIRSGQRPRLENDALMHGIAPEPPSQIFVFDDVERNAGGVDLRLETFRRRRRRMEIEQAPGLVAQRLEDGMKAVNQADVGAGTAKAVGVRRMSGGLGARSFGFAAAAASMAAAFLAVLFHALGPGAEIRREKTRGSAPMRRKWTVIAQIYRAARTAARTLSE